MRNLDVRRTPKDHMRRGSAEVVEFTTKCLDKFVVNFRPIVVPRGVRAAVLRIDTVGEVAVDEVEFWAAVSGCPLVEVGLDGTGCMCFML